MADQVQSKKRRAAKDILQKNIVTVTNVVKSHINDFFLRLFQNALVSANYGPDNKMMTNDQYATKLYMECMTAVEINPSNFSTLINILNAYPLLRETVERMKTEGVEAGLMRAESDGMSTGAGAVVPWSETMYPTQTALPVQDKPSSSAQSLDAPCTDKYLAKPARAIQDWENIAMDFDITSQEAETIKKDYPQQYELQKRKMLMIWKEKFGSKATYRRLVEIFESVDNKLLADLVREDFLQNQVKAVGSVSSHQAAMQTAIRAIIATVPHPLSAHASSYTTPVQVPSSEKRTLAQSVQTVSATAESIEVDFLEKVADRLPAKWRMIGIALGVSSDQLDGIRQRWPGDQTQCFVEVFEIWKNHPTVTPFSWVGVVQALQRNFVGEPALTTELMKDYSIQESSLKTSSLKDPPTLPDFMEQVATFIPAKYFKFGLVMGVKSEVLSEFRALHSSDRFRCFESIFSYWEKGQPDANPFMWSSVVTALRHVFVGENALARKIDRMIVQSSSVFFTHASLATPTETILNVTHLAEVLRELQGFRAWKTLGENIGLDAMQLKAISIDCKKKGVDENLRQVLLKWLKRNHNEAWYGVPTWSNLVKAIKPSDHQLAMNIQEKHCLHQSSLVRRGDAKLTVDDLLEVENALPHFTKWHKLGLKLGLSPIILDEIEDDYSQASMRLHEVLKQWLQKNYRNPDKHEDPTWKWLASAVDYTDRALAETIRRDHC